MKSKNNPSTPNSGQVHALLYEYHEFIRPPEHIRSKLDIGYTFDGRVIEFFEIRPDWQDSTIIRHFSYVKIRFIKSTGVWKLYWKRASGKWESYKPFPESDDLEKVLEIIDEDKYHCFKG